MKGDALGHRPSGAATVGCTSEQRRSTDSPCSRRAPSKSRDPARKACCCMLHAPCGESWTKTFHSPRPQSSQHSSPHGIRGGFNHWQGRKNAGFPAQCQPSQHGIQPKPEGTAVLKPRPQPRGETPWTSPRALAMSATLASLLQTGRGALWLTAQDLAPRSPPPSSEGGKPPVSAKDWEGFGPRRPAHSRESLSGKGTEASSTPQRRREAPGVPPLGRRPNSRAMASFVFHHLGYFIENFRARVFY